MTITTLYTNQEFTTEKVYFTTEEGIDGSAVIFAHFECHHEKIIYPLSHIKHITD